MAELHWTRFETDRSPKGHGLRARHRNRTWIAYQNASGRWRVAPTDRPQQSAEFRTWPEARAWAQTRASTNPRPQAVHSRARRRNREVTTDEGTSYDTEQHVELVDGETGEVEWEGTLGDFLTEGLRATKLRMHPDDVAERFAKRGFVDFGSSAFAPLATLREANPERRRSVILPPDAIVIVEHGEGDTWQGTIEEFWDAQDPAVWSWHDRQEIECDLMRGGVADIGGGAEAEASVRLANPDSFPGWSEDQRGVGPKPMFREDFEWTQADVKRWVCGGSKAIYGPEFTPEQTRVFDETLKREIKAGTPPNEASRRAFLAADALERRDVARNQTMAKRKTTKRKNPGRDHLACGDEISDKDCRQLQHVYESARERGFSKQRAAQQAWGSLDNPGRKRRRRNGARGRKKNGAGFGAFLGSLVGGALGLGVASVPLAIIGSIGGGALGGHLGAPKDRKRRGSIGGAAGAAILGPIGAAAGGYIAGREPDRNNNPGRRRRNRSSQAGRIYTIWKHPTNKRWFVADGVSPAATAAKGYDTKAEAVRSAERLIHQRGVAARIAFENPAPARRRNAKNPKTTAVARRR